MVERIIMLGVFFWCSVPFWIISTFNKDSITPISFWSGGEGELKTKLKSIKEYNYEMALLYRKCAIAFFGTGLCSCIHLTIGIVLLGLELTIGIVLVYKKYIRILHKYS